jgi:hypothetical protein
MLSQGNMGAPLHRYIGQVGPRFWDSGSLMEWKWCHYVLVEADIHLKPLHISISCIYKAYKPLVCCLKGMWLHPYTVTPAKLAPDLGIQVHLWSENDAITSWLRLISTSDHFIHPYYTATKTAQFWARLGQNPPQNCATRNFFAKCSARFAPSDWGKQPY